MAILVTGGAGYIGSHTALELIESNIAKEGEVIIVDNMQKGHAQAVKGGKLYPCDLRDVDNLEKVFAENEIDAVIHFAADSLVGESMTMPFKYYGNNFISTLRLLETMNKFGCKKIVFSSTAATYGEPVNTPILESDPTIPTNVYGETKLAVEKLLRWTEEAYGIKYVSLRYFNAAGAHKSGEIGEDHAPETHLIPLVLQVALGKREHIGIFGDDYPTPDGTCIRDYIHVTDLASAHIAALKRLNDINKSGIYNLGSGNGFSVREVIDVCREVTGHKIPEVTTPRRAGDPAILVASNERASADLGFKMRYPTLQDIVATAWGFHKKFPNGYEG